MEIIDWVIIAIIGTSFLVIALLVARKWKKMLLLDLSAMPAAQLKRKKYKLMEERFERKTKDALGSFGKVFAPVKGSIGDSWRKLNDKLVRLERKYRHAEVEGDDSKEGQEKTRQKIAELMEKGATLVKDGQHAEAEELFVDVVRLDTQNVEAFEYLGEIYLQKKEYDHALESLEYAKKLNPKDDKIYYVLGKVYQDQEDDDKALEYFKQAVELADSNPRNLDALVYAALDAEDKLLARQMINKLRKVNPEHGKLEEMEERMTEI